MFTAKFIDGPRAGEEDTVFGREPMEGERVYYMRFGVQGWVRVMPSWEAEQGCVIYELKSTSVVDLKAAGGPGNQQGVAEYTFVREVGPNDAAEQEPDGAGEPEDSPQGG